jgi:hypothetical protein
MTMECRNCVRQQTGDDGLCDNCRSAHRLRDAREALRFFMSDEGIEALVEFLAAKEENDAL